MREKSRDGVHHVMESSGKGVLDMESDSMSRDSQKGTPHNTKDYIRRGFSLVNKSFVLNSNSISYILVIV